LAISSKIIKAVNYNGIIWVSRLSLILSGMTSKPSRVYNLAHIIFGYIIASALISPSSTESFSDYLLLIGLIGGFIGACLFYVKPFEKVISAMLGRPSSFSSPFILEMKGKIIGGIYFSLSLLIINFNPHLAAVILEHRWLPPSLIIASIVVFAINLYDARELPARIKILDAYYQAVDELLAQGQVKGFRSLEFSLQSIGSFKTALARGDWLEAARLAGVSGEQE